MNEPLKINLTSEKVKSWPHPKEIQTTIQPFIITLSHEHCVNILQNAKNTLCINISEFNQARNQQDFSIKNQRINIISF